MLASKRRGLVIGARAHGLAFAKEFALAWARLITRPCPNGVQDPDKGTADRSGEGESDAEPQQVLLQHDAAEKGAQAQKHQQVNEPEMAQEAAAACLHNLFGGGWFHGSGLKSSRRLAFHACPGAFSPWLSFVLRRRVRGLGPGVFLGFGRR